MAKGRLFGLCESSSVVGLVLLLLLLVVNGGRDAVRGELSDGDREADRESCFETVRSWSKEQLSQLSSQPPESALDRVKLRDLLFFLHIPRTGGRTFHQCFLKHLFESNERCKASYDKLRIDRSHPGCRVISTHDDYSLLDDLPLNMTSVVTSIRAPVDRVLSSYEFSIEVAARSLRRVSRKFTGNKTLRGPVKGGQSVNTLKGGALKGGHSVNTLDIWPWKYLVRIMESDLFARRDARETLEIQLRATELSADDSYDASAIAMPFAEFVNHPAAHELVHNGETFQVAGLTNISYSANAGSIRHCVIRFPPLGKYVLDVAKKRLDSMLHVGLTERQNESALFFAKVMGGQISTEQVMKNLLSSGPGKPKKGVPSSNASRLRANFTSLDDYTEEEVIDEMLASYQNCVGTLRKAQEERRSMSLETVKPIDFSRKRRKLIPDDVMQKVAALNSLDTELYEYAEVLFQKQQEFLQHGDFHFTKETKMSRGDIDDRREALKDRYGFPYSREYLQALRGLTTLWVLVIFMVLVTVLYVVTKRRGHRVKKF